MSLLCFESGLDPGRYFAAFFFVVILVDVTEVIITDFADFTGVNIANNPVVVEFLFDDLKFGIVDKVCHDVMPLPCGLISACGSHDE